MEQNIYKLVFKVTHAEGSGSCFYLKSCNLFVTNYHVVEGFHAVAIHDSERNPYLAKVVLVNPALDIALLAVEHDFSMLPDFPLAGNDTLAIGGKIRVAGYPYGMPFTVTEGTVSAPKQLMDGQYYIQTDAAVNPGNSGGPIINEKDEIVGITVSKINDADNMGFGIRVETLHKLLESVNALERDKFQVQCESCEELISEPDDYCPSCGEELPEGIFEERHLSPLTEFCESAIERMGINPVLARDGYEAWCFHKGSSEIRIFVYNRAYLFMVSPVNLLPKKEVEGVLDYMLSTDFAPYKMAIDGRQIYLMYRLHLSDITEQYEEQIRENMVNLALKADEMDNMLVERFGCEFSAYSKQENEA
ncbi:MAG TPA: trypsin-like peptidase domain-containing protein [Candidatus Odoribacter faecigallinarum]|uniref:Trypsin-like peptidase domain-containing protein n=1 Tax=Candidatus Odoribacter faecigallinarum TaxID=2838706 RepID=A0A9D2AB60_9BACT|nr:trypsin-like peptidase domain-containing protein [Candidatus Odoribacter faecigallinarum]